jgi:hypothetical protein
MKSKVLSVFVAAVASLTAAAEVDLSMYKPVDPTKNLVKNGGFETCWTAKKVLPYWGNVSENAFQDKTVKHSGNASLKIGNVPKSYVAMAFNLGKIESLQNDLLIRGWCKYENIENSKECFIGIWTSLANGRNSRKFALITIPKGSGNWFYFEEVLKVDALKAACANIKPEPPVSCSFRINIYKDSGWLWLDDIEIIPLEKK